MFLSGIFNSCKGFRMNFHSMLMLLSLLLSLPLPLPLNKSLDKVFDEFTTKFNVMECLLNRMTNKAQRTTAAHFRKINLHFKWMKTISQTNYGFCELCSLLLLLFLRASLNILMCGGALKATKLCDFEIIVVSFILSKCCGCGVSVVVFSPYFG